MKKKLILSLVAISPLGALGAAGYSARSDLLPRIQRMTSDEGQLFTALPMPALQTEAARWRGKLGMGLALLPFNKKIP